jgi:hypothetical protein
MNFKKFIKSTFGKDMFSVREDDIVKERVRNEKEVERVSDDIKRIQEKIQKLMIESKGQPTALKMLNIQKIKALTLESKTKQMEAGHYLHQMQVLLLVEAMKEREKTEKKSKITEEILNSDMDKLSHVLLDTDVREAIKEGRLDLVKEKLERVFGREEILVDDESQELMETIKDLEGVDEQTAVKMAKQKARELAEEKEGE